MLNHPPAFQFYPKDFLTDDKVIVMNLEEKGVYIILLSYCWNNNGLTKNQNDLKNMCGNPENWECIWEKVGKCFYEKNGKFHNKRLEKELKKQKKWREKSRLGGIRSGISRGKKVEPSTKGGSKMVQTKNEPKSNSSSSSSSSFSNKGKKEEKIFFDSEKVAFFNISAKDINTWKKAYPKVDIKIELNRMAAWLVADLKRLKSNYKRFINGWLSRTQDFGGTKFKNGKSQISTQEFDEMQERAMKQR